MIFKEKVKTKGVVARNAIILNLVHWIFIYTFIGHIFERISIFYHEVLKISSLKNRIFVIYTNYNL